MNGGNNMDEETKELITSLLMSDFDEIKPLIRSKVVNYEKNKEYLKEIPYIMIMDMAMVFEIWIGQKRGQFAISNVCLDLWGVNVAELYIQARENEKESFRVAPIKEVISEYIEIIEPGDSAIGEIHKANAEPMLYVVTNDIGYCGATVIASKETFKKFSYEHDYEKIIILPSSIHELIIFGTYDGYEYDIPKFREMLKEINDTQVDEHERLSYSVYVYDSVSNGIRIA
jgi:hypothetical protein